MDFFPYLGLAVLATLLLVILRPLRPEIATLLSLAAGGIILVSVLARLRTVLQAMTAMATRAEIQPFFLQTVLKVIGLAYLAGFTGQVCRDAGEGAMAAKVELVGKVAILLVGLPVVWAVLETMLKLF
ncbi:MAG: stage III sporulation protein AD [Bacillota bacterium]